MGSKNSIKSKSQHLSVHTTRVLKDKPIDWQGNGIYVLNKAAAAYQPVFEMKDLEFKIVSTNYGEILYVKEHPVDKVLTWWSPTS